jgi:hypothetical protein
VVCIHNLVSHSSSPNRGLRFPRPLRPKQFLRALTPEDWTRVDIYAPLVQSLNLDGTVDVLGTTFLEESLITMSQTQPGRSPYLLPGITNIGYNPWHENITLLRCLLAPSILTFGFDESSYVMDDGHRYIIENIPATLRVLRMPGVFEGSLSPLENELIPGIFHRITKIWTLHCEDRFLLDVISALPNLVLPDLRCLILNTYERGVDPGKMELLTRIPTSLPTLREVSGVVVLHEF